jgi:hypothetical protein
MGGKADSMSRTVAMSRTDRAPQGHTLVQHSLELVIAVTALPM